MATSKIQCESCSTRGEGVFCELDSEHLKQLDIAKTTNSYKPHQTIFYEGNQPYGLYCISTGKVKVYKMDADGHQQIVRLAGPGDILGYRCLLADETYSATAETIEDATICFIDRKSFVKVLQEHPVTAFHVLKKLSADLKQAEDQSLNLVHKSIRERLAELLLTFKEKYGRKTSKGIELDIRLTRVELSELIGTTQESVIRLISDFKDEKLVSVEGRRITLTDVAALTDVANLVD